jgi:hypothetical protein
MDKPKPIPKAELLDIMDRFIADKERGISMALFAEMCGINKDFLLDVFQRKTEPLSERTQIRVSRAYHNYKDGYVRIMQNRDRSKFVEYRREPERVVVRSQKIALVDGRLQVKVGLRNPRDYSRG